MNTDWTGVPDAPDTDSIAARTRSYVTWNLADVALGIIGTLLLIFILASISEVLVTGHYGEETPEAYFGSFVATIAWDVGFVALVLYLVNPKFMSLLWTEPMGVNMIYAGIVAIIVGIFWMRRVIRIHV